MKKLNKHNNPFKTPPGYFKKLEVSLKEIEKTPLNKIKDEGFKVPKGYFESFEFNPPKADVKQRPKTLGLYYWVSGVAASILLVSILVFNKKEESVSYDDLALSDYESYWDENGMGLDVDELNSYMPLDELDYEDVTSLKLDDSVLLEYLQSDPATFEELNIYEDAL